MLRSPECSKRRALAVVGFLALSFPSLAHADETAPVTSRTLDWLPFHRSPGASFGQEEGEEGKDVAIRLEASWLGAIVDSRFRYGKSGRSNTIQPQSDLAVPRFEQGERAALSFKVLGCYGMGFSYLGFSAEGPTRPARSDIRVGSPQREIQDGERASARVEFQQLCFDLRLWVVDTPGLRFECYMGFGWTSYRVGVHPEAPFPLASGGVALADTEATEAFFTPVLGIFLVWNPTPRLGLYVDTILNYFAWSKPGSSAGLTRAGFRVRLFGGVEAVLGIFVLTGQVYDLRDAFGSRASGHEFRQSSWIAGGPEMGLSATF